MAASPFLPFARRPLADHLAQPKRVYAWWHVFARSIDNREKDDPTEYYNDAINPASMSVDDTAGPDKPTVLYKEVGGLLRDRPLHREATTTVEADWLKEHAKADIRNAIAAGIDGFIFNRTGTGTANFRHRCFIAMFAAAEELANGFEIIPCLDGVATQSTDPTVPIVTHAQSAADYLAVFKNNRAWARTATGAYWVGGYEPAQIQRIAANEGVNSPTPERLQQARDWWDAFLLQLSGVHGMQVKLFFSYARAQLGLEAAARPGKDGRCETLASFTTEFGPLTTSRWPGLAAGGDVNIAARMEQAAGVGQRWAVTTEPQLCAPKNHLKTYRESRNGFALRQSCQEAIDLGADWLVVICWNDYSEQAIAPSARGQYGWMDLLAWYAHRLKFGSWPAIERDVAIGFTRVQKMADFMLTGTSAQLAPMKFSGTAALEDRIEGMFWLTATAACRIVDPSNAANGVTYTLPAGFHVLTCPWFAGQPRLEIRR